jgi:hypothetical protein
MLGGFTRSLSALVHFTLHTGAGVDSVVYSTLNTLYIQHASAAMSLLPSLQNVQRHEQISTRTA